MRKTRNGNKMHCGQPSGTYVLDYDGFGRLRDGWHYLYGNPVNEWSERNITYDFGARFYDPLTARWLSPDSMADKYTSLTQYNYCGGDPVSFVDPDGLDRTIVINNNKRLITIKAKFIYSDRNLDKSISQAISLLNNMKGLKYDYSGTSYDVQFKLESEQIPLININDTYSSSNYNRIDLSNNKNVGKNSKAIAGTSPTNHRLIIIGKETKNDYYSIAHEMIHSLGGNNPIEGQDRHSDEGLMRKSRPKVIDDTSINQGTINDIIEKGHGQTIHKQSLFNSLRSIFYE